MATYYGTYGQKVQYLASDPSDPQTGQVWYNSTSGVLKVRAVSTVGTFASGGNMNTAQPYAVGTQNATLGFGNPVTETYNGTSWTSLPAAISPNRDGLAGAGTQTAALGFGGPIGGGTSQSWNGSSWTGTPSLNTARGYLAGAGATNTAALAFGGYPSNTTTTAATESWNGSAWTSVNSMNTARGEVGGAGTQGTSLAFGGEPDPDVGGVTAATESWNGTSWTTVSSLNTGRKQLKSGTGIATAAVAFGGYISGPSYSTATELWNGTSWTNNPTGLAAARGNASNAGTLAAAIVLGGPPTSLGTEEWNGPGSATTKTVTVS
jgi:hypothetical protein